METPRVYTLFAGPVQPGIAPGPGWWRATKAHRILMPACAARADARRPRRSKVPSDPGRKMAAFALLLRRSAPAAIPPADPRPTMARLTRSPARPRTPTTRKKLRDRPR